MIGVFDSGIGGLTVVSEIFKTLPEYKIIYFGDLARSPYGTKTSKTIVNFSRQIVKFLINKGAKIIVIACNTASSEATDVLRKEFSLPIIEVISPAVRQAIKVTCDKRIGVIGTRGTIQSQAYQKALKNLDKDIKLYSKACPLFVPLVEEGFLTRPETRKIVRYYLRELKHAHIDTLILGCTHYPLLRKVIKNIMGPKINLIDSAKVVEIIKDVIKKNGKLKSSLKKDKKHQFYFSDMPNNLKEVAPKFLGKPIKNIKLIDLEELSSY